MIPIAYIALKGGMETTNNDIRGFAANTFGHHEIPKKVVFMDELPKNATGKILKRALRKQGEIERGIKA